MSGLVLYVRSTTGDVVAVEVPASATVGHVIEEHARVTGRSSALAVAGTEALPSHGLLADLGIGAETTLHEVDGLRWHPDHLRGPGGASPVVPTQMLLGGPGTEAGGDVLTASARGSEMCAALNGTYRAGSLYRSPQFAIEEYHSSMGFGLSIGAPIDGTPWSSPGLLLYVDANSMNRYVRGVYVQQGEPSLHEKSPFRLLVDERLRVSYEVHSGSPQQAVVPAGEIINRLFAEAVANLPDGAALHPFVFSTCEENFQWTVTE
eukprot:TRINITY_DN50538_c0_g1_i1.p1 TRINITY_DN50538_c0_g1~~TRINITY_DN50538_c0_g1_i1.p1  ORF type:complete len:297 (+),score=56.66 TRINITY_DN50538_c0_g1_i1:103-891(+)